MAKQQASDRQTYRALLIAPRSDLPDVDNEVQRVANALHPEFLFGTVRLADVMDAVSRQQYDIIWFSAHGGPDGIQLSDGLLTPTTLTQILRSYKPGLVVINTCTSLQIATEVHDDLQCAVIATIVDVPDRDAFVTGSTLAAALSRGMSIADAYNVSRPGGQRQYVLLNGTIRLGGDDKVDDVLQAVLRNGVETQKRLTYLQQQIDALHQDVRETNKRIDHMGDRFAPALTRKRASAWVAAFALFVLAYALVEFRDGIDMSLPAALLFATFVAAVSGWLFVYGLGFRWDI